MNSSGILTLFGKTTRNDIVLILFCFILFSGFIYQGFITHESMHFFSK
ncbi:MAG: hypothetical protein ACD_64C00251G0002 [uncultured bacterium]|nr:MAG: hypothetical protein ACD_64C00251G0002 [uncultured bacterium]